MTVHRKKHLVSRIHKLFDKRVAGHHHSREKQRSCDTERHAYTNVDPIPNDTFNPFIGDENEIQYASSPATSSHKGRPTPPKGASSSATQCTSRLRARVTTAKTEQRMKKACTLIKTSQITRAVDDSPDVHCRLADRLVQSFWPRLGRILLKNRCLLRMKNG